MAKQVEAGIRDFLATHLSWLAPDLQLIGKEYHLADSQGTDGRIDILARDSNRCYVIIEVKRSKKAARETLTEVFKYAHLLQLKHHVRPSEIRIMVVSTVWDELRRAFAEFKTFAQYPTEGYQVFLNEDDLPSRVEQIVMSETPLARLLSPSQINLLYTQKSQRDNAIQRIVKRLLSIGIDDFIVLLQHGHGELITAPFNACVAIQRYPAEQYMEILEHNGGLDDEESLEYLKDQFDEEDELLRHLEDRAFALLTPKARADQVEIGYPEKFLAMLPKWPVERIERHGLFANDERLDDAQIIEELSGLNGTNQSSFIGTASSDNPSRVKELGDNAVRCLKFNPVWAAHVRHALASLQNETRPYKLYAEIYSPDNIIASLLSLASTLKEEYLPSYCVLIDFETDAAMYTGTVLWRGQCKSFKALLSEIFPGGYYDYILWHLHFGPSADLEQRILDFLEVRYSSDVQTISNSVPTLSKDIVIEDGQIKSRSDNGWYPISRLLAACPNFVLELIAEDAAVVMRV